MCPWFDPWRYHFKIRNILEKQVFTDFLFFRVFVRVLLRAQIQKIIINGDTLYFVNLQLSQNVQVGPLF
jgi:hypothetical protein